MYKRLDAAEVGGSLSSRLTLLQGGMTEREIARGVRDGELHLIRRGWYLDADLYRSLRPEDRHLAHVLAVARDGQQRAVASHTSAAVLWGLPLYRISNRKVHLIVQPGQRISSGPDVMRHLHHLDESDVVTLHGVRATSLRRTVFDLVRTLSTEAAVAVADAAEREMTFANWEWDAPARDKWRGDLSQLIDAVPGARGIRRARRVAALADGRAQLPLESVTRLQLSRLGFGAPRLQVPVPDPHGGKYWMDLAMDEVRTFLEVDGAIKYLDASFRDGRTMEQVLLEEKAREDWVRGMTSYRVVRCGADHCATPGELGARLRAFGIRPSH